MRLSQGIRSSAGSGDNNLVLVYNTLLPSASNMVELYFEGETNILILWGDNSSNSYSASEGQSVTCSHTYTSSGMYTVTVVGTSNGTFSASPNSSSIPSLTTCLSFGNFNFTSLYGCFRGCSNLTTVPKILPSSVQILDSTFSGCTSLNDPNIALWDTSNVTDFSYMFENCSNFNQNLSQWNTSLATSTRYMFTGCTNFVGNGLGTWDVSNVTNAAYMFANCTQFTGTELGSWNTSSIINMSGMFISCPNFVGTGIGAWNTSNVIDMSSLFQNCEVFNQNIGNWDTQKVINMTEMLKQAQTFNQNLSGWCVGWQAVEPYQFRAASPLSPQNRPVWGTCPNKSVSTNITYIGSANGDTSASLPAHTIGDLILCFAYVESSTNPSPPSGWNTLSLRSVTSSSLRIAYKIAASSAEISGTWTGYTSISFVVYRNVEVDQFSFTSSAITNGSSLSITYSSATTWRSLAWTLVFFAHNSTDVGTGLPATGFTSRVSTTTQGSRILVADTTATTPFYSGETVTLTGTTSNWQTAVIRLRNKIA